MNLLGHIGNTYMNKVSRIYVSFKCTQGVYNPYVSEGLAPHERRLRKKAKRHGLTCMSLNKTSILSAAQYMSNSVADMAFISFKS